MEILMKWNRASITDRVRIAHVGGDATGILIEYDRKKKTQKRKLHHAFATVIRYVINTHDRIS